MGRFDALTNLETKPIQPTAPPEKPESHGTPAHSPPPEKQKTDLHANLQAGKQVSLQTGKPASRQADKPANLQAGKQVFIEKYSSYLTREYKRELKRIAWESDRNEYEVLIEAVEQYLARQKQPQ